MRCEAQKRRASTLTKSAPAGHDDGGGHLRARVVSQAALAVMDKERAALDGEAGVVGLRRDDAGLDRKARAPEGVGLSVRGGVDGVRSGRDGRPRLRRWTKPLMSSQRALKRRPGVWPRGRCGVGLIGPERRRFAFADRSDDRRRVERITSWTPHGSPSLFFHQTGNPNCRRTSIPDILMYLVLIHQEHPCFEIGGPIVCGPEGAQGVGGGLADGIVDESRADDASGL